MTRALSPVVITANDALVAGVCARGVRAWRDRRAPLATAVDLATAVAASTEIAADCDGYGYGTLVELATGCGPAAAPTLDGFHDEDDAGRGASYGDGFGYGLGDGFGDGDDGDGSSSTQRREAIMGKWGDYGSQMKTKSEDGKYVKLADGDSIEFAVAPETEPGQEQSYWLDGRRVEPGTRGARLDTKVVLCVYDVTVRRMRVLRLTPRTFVDLAEKLERFGEDHVWELTRSKDGKGFVTYKLERLDKLTDQQRQARDREEPYDVLQERGVTPLPSQIDDTEATDPDVPF